MTTIWQNWCRFCAKCDSEDVDSVCKMESIANHIEIVNKYFTLSLSPFEGIQSSICEDCCYFVSKLEHFERRCSRADKLFNELLELNEVSEMDLQALRFRHGVDEEDIKKYNNIMEQVLEEQSISALAESIDPDNGGPKKEVLDSRSNGLKKKRGRPRKSNELHQQVKKEFLDHDELSNGEPDFRDTENESHIFIEEALVPKRQTKRRAAMKRDVESDDDDIPLKKLQKVKRIRLRTDNVCEICSKNYSRRYLLNLHIRAVHSNEELPFVCSKCPKRFVTETKLRVHEMIHLPDEEKFKHPCPYCGKKFAEMRQVQTHIRVVHQGDRPFICEQCGKSFATKRGLAEHRVTHSDEYPFHCPHCPKKFKSNPLLKRHVDTHNNTTYTCPHCGISLNTQRTLKMHMLVHSDVKKYKCQHCGNEYKRAKALKEHLILHSGLRPYSCPFCDKTFTNGSNCRSHKKKAHPAELAALEASGEVQRVANVPKLEQLQPK